MNMISTNTLSESQKKHLISLQETCRDHDHISMTFPIEEEVSYYLLYDADSLLSALCAFFNENGDCECYFCTLPEKRQRGYFNLLLKELVKEAEDCDFIFPVDESCQDTVNTLKALEASFWYQEHMMSLTFSEFQETMPAGFPCLPEEITATASASANGPVQYHFLRNGSPIGSCFLDLSGNSAYFYGFEIAEQYRNQGLGSICLFLFLKTFFEQPADERPHTVFLQVSGRNLPAMALYQKAGFRITESLSYYVY